MKRQDTSPIYIQVQEEDKTAQTVRVIFMKGAIA